MLSRSPGHRSRRARLVALAALTASATIALSGPATATAPVATAPVATAPVTVHNASFEAGDALECWQSTGHGSAEGKVRRTGDARTGRAAAKLTVTRISSGNRKLVTDRREGCAPGVTGGLRYALALHYRSTVPVSLAVYYRDAAGTWRWWTQGATSPASGSWRELTTVTAPVPAGADALSFGLVVSSKGTAWVDDASASEAPGPPATSPTPGPAATTARLVRVSTADELHSALAAATPGTTISMSPGTYRGRFVLSRSGTGGAPIRITGPRSARIDGGSVSSGYALHLNGVHHARVEGISIGNAKKAVVLDSSSDNVLHDLDVSRAGQELVLLRNLSTRNVVSNSEIHGSGLTDPGYGEGVYIGLASSNWGAKQSITAGEPDRSDHNSIVGNHVHDTTAECVDVKEGTTGGRITGNRFDGTGLRGANHADSWVDVKGDGWTVSGNTGTNAGRVLHDGFQTHSIEGWGNRNVFTGNTAHVNGPGHAVRIDTDGTGNVVHADNTATGASRGLTNVSTTP
ncbi:right-handed parallel beta-helix repeat-containing protein [Paenibacillus sp. TRM 82003]|uniref:NosD domain-containing protein n=1 Tax=Kineococcus sp. TRM81007 TaxID=2925831 RepID=UPI001F598112|nr:NosD domain-containing protein [Kineococcus sp. TRM81007]MCI2237839.1 right-handed parallel beta-helix repeat-containing protein [Kineococcus sp. TRM81007]MCI3919909.1 right-handed parallel beta-helix repeat-containing protein [Paenibacillus sp. TRM 82003]